MLPLGPVTIRLFGVLVVIAILFGHAVIRRRATAGRLDLRCANELFGCIILGGLIGSHLVYSSGGALRNPVNLVKLWEGMSSIGGFLGAVAGAVFYVYWAALGQKKWRYLDTIAYAFPFGWFFGRFGCFVAFDHPGEPTQIFLGQVYRDGVVRHNLGLDEALFTISLAAAFYLLGRRPRPAGFFVASLPLLYAPFRFMADFLRVVDPRYEGLTLGQWSALGFVVLGIALLWKARWNGTDVEAVFVPPASSDV
jgi:phosphatidylglycerol:prolipoprotein diacylglycerol transferase